MIRDNGPGVLLLPAGPLQKCLNTSFNTFASLRSVVS
jgi:hypothetical protein